MLKHAIIASLVATVSGFVRRADSSTFSLYAYGEGIGGLPIFAAGDVAYIGDPSQSNLSNAAPIIFMKNDNSSWTAAPNVTDPSQTPPFDAAVFSIPGPNSAGRHVGFVQGTGNATVETEGFMTYGGVVLHEGEAGIETLWYALPSVDAASTWSLNWNATGDDTDGKILVTLKTNPPSDGGNPNPVLAM